MSTTNGTIEHKIESATASIRINPIKAARCSRCHGSRGYQIVMLPDNQFRIELCCGEVGETEYQRVMNEQEMIEKQLVLLRLQIEELRGLTLAGMIQNAVKRLRTRKQN